MSDEITQYVNLYENTLANMVLKQNDQLFTEEVNANIKICTDILTECNSLYALVEKMALEEPETSAKLKDDLDKAKRELSDKMQKLKSMAAKKIKLPGYEARMRRIGDDARKTFDRVSAAHKAHKAHMSKLEVSK